LAIEFSIQANKWSHYLGKWSCRQALGRSFILLCYHSFWYYQGV